MMPTMAWLAGVVADGVDPATGRLRPRPWDLRLLPPPGGNLEAQAQALFAPRLTVVLAADADADDDDYDPADPDVDMWTHRGCIVLDERADPPDAVEQQQAARRFYVCRFCLGARQLYVAQQAEAEVEAEAEAEADAPIFGHVLRRHPRQLLQWLQQTADPEPEREPQPAQLQVPLMRRSSASSRTSQMSDQTDDADVTSRQDVVA